jgi:hypothetical protein
LYIVIDGVDRCHGISAATSPVATAAFFLTAELGTQLAVAAGEVVLVLAAAFLTVAAFDTIAGTTLLALVLVCEAAAWTAGADDCVTCAEPKIQVHTPFSQPQNPPLEDEVEASGVGVAAVSFVFAVFVLSDADGEALGDADAFFGVALALVLGFGVALGE